MACRKFIGLLAGILVLGFASLALAGIPNLDNSYAVGGPASVLICPACDGDRMDTARDCSVGSAGSADATVTLTVLDINFDPVVGYPAVDMWLVANGMCVCPNGSIADGPTNASGVTTWTGTLCAGGCSNDSSMNCFINPHGVLNQAGLPISVNSPDMNCDLVVNLTDVVLFTGCYYGTCDYCCDFYCDGNCNLSDVVIMSQHIQHACP